MIIQDKYSLAAKWTPTGVVQRLRKTILQPGDLVLMVQIGFFIWRIPASLKKQNLKQFLEEIHKSSRPKTDKFQDSVERIIRLRKPWLRLNKLKSYDTCYVRALTLFRFADAQGEDIKLHFVAERKEKNKDRLKGHAWITIADKIIEEPSLLSEQGKVKEIFSYPQNRNEIHLSQVQAVEKMDEKDATNKKKEFELLLNCARTHLTPENVEIIRSLCTDAIDWDFIIGKAYWHSLIPLIYKSLNKYCAELVPKEKMELLSSYYLSSSRRNLLLVGVLFDVIDLLLRHGIESIPYKGPSLAANVYGDISYRKFCDLDIVVRQEDVPNARDALVAAGYKWKLIQGQKPNNDKDNLRKWHEYNFVHPQGYTTIDLHWRITPQRFPLGLNMNNLWPHVTKKQLLNRKVNQFSTEDLLILLCIHGAKDLWWVRVGWICDVAELIKSNSSINWGVVTDRAKSIGAIRMLYVGLGLAEELFDTPLPPDIQREINEDKAAPKLINLVKKKILGECSEISNFVAKSRFRIAIRERVKDKLPSIALMFSSAVRSSFIPQDKDKEWVQLPHSLYFLYYFIRPLRMLYRMLIILLKR